MAASPDVTIRFSVRDRELIRNARRPMLSNAQVALLAASQGGHDALKRPSPDSATAAGAYLAWLNEQDAA